jgi:Rieske Fe-S protein
MPGEDQERFEDYLELEQYIEQLQAGRVAHPPAELTPSQASIYRMAALFRSASPESSELRPEFAAELQARLEQELQQRPKIEPQPLERKKEQKKRHVSRRALLTGGAAAAASLVAGGGLGYMVEQARAANSNNQSDPYSGHIIASGVPTTWHLVTSVADLGDKAMRFVTDTVVGYIIRDDGDGGDPDKGKIIAISAACTHMGCIVQWQDSDRKYHCPCHGGLFSEYGHVDAGAAPIRYLRPLPRLNTKIVNGNVYVEVPVGSGSTAKQSWQ